MIRFGDVDTYDVAKEGYQKPNHMFYSIEDRIFGEGSVDGYYLAYGSEDGTYSIRISYDYLNFL